MLKQQKGKILYLEGVRGIAAITVVITHFVIAFYGAVYYMDVQQIHTAGGLELVIGQSVLAWYLSGNFAVPVLFVLSAYVLSYRFFCTQDEEVVRRSACRRYFRLAVPNAVSVLFGYVVLRLGGICSSEASGITLSHWLDSFYHFDADFFAALKQGLWDGFFAYDPYTSFSVSYNPAMWTMSFELAGSFFVFAFLLLFGRMTRRYAVYAALFFIVGRGYYSAFLFGLLIADGNGSLWGERLRSLLERRSVLAWLLLVAGGCLTGYFSDGRNVWSQFLDQAGAGLRYAGFDLWILYHNIGAAMMLIGVMFNPLLRRLLASRPLVFLGRLAYSMYLIHVVLLCSAGCSVFLYLQAKGWSYHGSVAGSGLACVPVILICSYGMARFIDEPSIRLARGIQRRYFPH